MKGMIRYLCKLASVNRSSYYTWLKAEKNRIEREQKDEADFLLIKDIHDSRNGKSGGRAIRMILENVYGVVMNLKKIYRLMKKFNLQTKIRRANPYKKIAKATQEHHTCPNRLNRQFVQTDPGMV
jgi:putative transposase